MSAEGGHSPTISLLDVEVDAPVWLEGSKVEDHVNWLRGWITGRYPNLPTPRFDIPASLMSQECGSIHRPFGKTVKVRAILDAIVLACRPNHRFGWEGGPGRASFVRIEHRSMIVDKRVFMILWGDAERTSEVALRSLKKLGGSFSGHFELVAGDVGHPEAIAFGTEKDLEELNRILAHE
jgi:hypothetical protein